MSEKINFKKGCINSFEELYTCYASAIYGIICREVDDRNRAQQIFQDVFLKIWKDIDQYDESRSRLFTWMLGICYKEINIVKTYQVSRHQVPAGVAR